MKFKKFLTLCLITAFSIGGINVLADTNNNGTGGGNTSNVANVGGFQNDSDVGYRVSIIKPTGELVAIRDITWSDPEQDFSSRTYVSMVKYGFENKLGDSDESTKNHRASVDESLISAGIPKPFAWNGSSSSFVGLGEDLKQWLVAGKKYYGDNSLGKGNTVVNKASGGTTSNTGGSQTSQSTLQNMTTIQLASYIVPPQ